LIDIFNESKPEIALFTETMMKDAISMKIDGYSFCGKARSEKGCGGVGIFVKNEIKHMTSPHETTKPIEIIWISIKRHDKKPLFIGVYYGWQESRVSKAEIEREMEFLADEIIQMK
jgi:exonuclease III